ncbi:hypothetical protein A2U01_0118180, partial [Trifolium medium]|nr:hypothetical protein [Trifolium medium]
MGWCGGGGSQMGDKEERGDAICYR